MLSHINVGTGNDLSINEMVQIMKRVVGFEGKVNFNSNKPDGASRKLMDTTRLSQMGWSYTIELEEGLRKTYDWYQKNYKKL